jgi:putative heme-binding domain-containing protein
LWTLVGDKNSPQGQRAHALWSLAGGGAIGESPTTTLLKNGEPWLQAWMVRLLGNRGRAGNAQLEEIRRLGREGAPEVKLQVAIAARKIEELEELPILIEVLASCGEDKLIPHIVWQNLHPLLEEQPGAFLREVAKLDLSQSPALAAVLPRASERILARKQFEAAHVAELFALVRDRAPQAARQCLERLAARIQSGEIQGERLAQLRAALHPPLTPLLANPQAHPAGLDAALLAVSWKDSRGIEQVRRTFTTSDLDAALRLRALAALVAAEDDKLLASVGKALAENHPSRDFAGQVLAALGRLDSPEVAAVVLTSFAKLPPDAHPKAVELLTQRPVWARRLVAAMGAGHISPALLNVNQAQKLVAMNDQELTAAVAKHWGTVRTTRDPARERFVADMRRLVRETPGDARRGIAVFSKVCGQCHKIHGQGQDVGPDITANGRASLEQLLSNVFDPSLVIGAAYQARTVRTADARIVTGLLVEDSEQRIVLKLQGGKLETIPRGEVDAVKVSELSLMPEGLEKQLQPQEIADLFAFIALDKHPDDPSAKKIPEGTR